MKAVPLTSSRNLWPFGIAAAFGVFVTGTAGLVVMSTYNNVELVSPDYYDQEIHFQDQIDRRENTSALGGQIELGYDEGQRFLTLALPAAHAGARITGEIQLYRPSAADLDRRVGLQLDAQGRQSLDARALSDGLWHVRVTWRVGEKSFAFDKKVVIGKQKPS